VVPPGDDRRLEDMLDAAGRAVQPTHPGWDTLPQRLAALPPASAPRARWRRLARVGGIAAMIPLTIGLLYWALTPGPPGIQQGNQLAAAEVIVQPKTVELTILSAADTPGETLYMPIVQRLAPHFLPHGGLLDPPPEPVPPPMPPGRRRPGIYPPQPQTRPTGVALVKDRRLILNLKEGDNIVRFTDVAATIDPTSVRFVSSTDPLGTKVIEQNFEYDLATADTLLKRYLDKKIICVDKAGQEVSGFLAAYDAGSIVLASAPTLPDAPHGKPPPRSTQTIARDTLQAIRLDEVPPGLMTKPTLVWKVRTQTPGQHDVTLTYLCGHIKWQADYVVLVIPGVPGRPDTLDVKGWVTLDNLTGATYRDAGLKLIAGDVNRIRDPWAPPEEREKELLRSARRMANGAKDMEVTKEFVEKSFFEYHLYTLTAPSTVKDRQIKQLNLLQTYGVQAKRRYVYDPMKDSRRVAVQLLAKNEKENQLGMPLPKGRVTFVQHDKDGELLFLGQDAIDHTAVKEELKLTYGYASDVVAEQREISSQQPNPRERISTIEVRVRNHKDEPIDARVLGRLWGHANWEVTKATHVWQKEDFQTISFDITLKPNTEAIIQYTVHYEF
jgi:hypothetical protein